MASTDPDSERKAADILGLYLKPPQHAAVFCVDEKTAIQALDRLEGRREYVRNPPGASVFSGAVELLSHQAAGTMESVNHILNQ